MQCNACAYEFTLKEIQQGDACPECEKKRAAAEALSAAPQLSPMVREVMWGYKGAQPVVVVDLHMSFKSMVIFMVKFALASIPALLILLLLVFGFAQIIGLLGSRF